LRRRFRDTIEPTLTPLAVDISHPFPFISNLGLNLALEVTDRGQRQRFVRLKVPIKGQRWIPLPEADGCVALEDVILNCLDLMFPAAVSIEGYPFRVIRGAKDSPWDQGETRALMPRPGNCSRWWPGSSKRAASLVWCGCRLAARCRNACAPGSPRTSRSTCSTWARSRGRWQWGT
jgi:hypothetical protein